MTPGTLNPKSPPLEVIGGLERFATWPTGEDLLATERLPPSAPGVRIFGFRVLGFRVYRVLGFRV